MICNTKAAPHPITARFDFQSSNTTAGCIMMYLTGRNEGSIKAVTKRLPVNTWADHCDRRLKGQTPVHGIGNPKCFSSPHHVTILRVAMSSLFSPTTHVCPKPVALWPTLWVAVWAWSSLISLPSAVSTLLWDLCWFPHLARAGTFTCPRPYGKQRHCQEPPPNSSPNCSASAGANNACSSL